MTSQPSIHLWIILDWKKLLKLSTFCQILGHFCYKYLYILSKQDLYRKKRRKSVSYLQTDLQKDKVIHRGAITPKNLKQPFENTPAILFQSLYILSITYPPLSLVYLPPSLPPLDTYFDWAVYRKENSHFIRKEVSLQEPTGQ